MQAPHPLAPPRREQPRQTLAPFLRTGVKNFPPGFGLLRIPDDAYRQIGFCFYEPVQDEAIGRRRPSEEQPAQMEGQVFFAR